MMCLGEVESLLSNLGSDVDSIGNNLLNQASNLYNDASDLLGTAEDDLNDVGAFFKGFTDPHAWEQGAAATFDGVLSLGGVLGSGPFSVDAANAGWAQFSRGLGGVADAAFALAGGLEAGGMAFESAIENEGLASLGNEAFWFGPGAQQAAIDAGANILSLTSDAADALAAGDPSLMFQESANFAANASGDISVFANAAANDLEQGYTFWNYELPQLLNNPNITSITYIFPK